MHKVKGDTNKATKPSWEWKGTGLLVDSGRGESGHEGSGGRVVRDPRKG